MPETCHSFIWAHVCCLPQTKPVAVLPFRFICRNCTKRKGSELQPQLWTDPTVRKISFMWLWNVNNRWTSWNLFYSTMSAFEPVHAGRGLTKQIICPNLTFWAKTTSSSEVWKQNQKPHHTMVWMPCGISPQIYRMQQDLSEAFSFFLKC